MPDTLVNRIGFDQDNLEASYKPPENAMIYEGMHVGSL